MECLTCGLIAGLPIWQVAYVNFSETSGVELDFEEVFDLHLFRQAAASRGLRVDTRYELFDFPRNPLPILQEHSAVGNPDDHISKAIKQSTHSGAAGVSFGSPLCYSVYYQADEGAQQDVAYFYAALIPHPQVS